VLLTGMVLAASLRALIPTTVVLLVAFGVGAHWPGLDGMLITYAMVAVTAAVAACYASALALHYKSQSAAPLMQAGTLALILLTTAYAPMELLQGWLQDVARLNPMTLVLDAVRQGFVGTIAWEETWPGIVALSAMLAIVAALSLRGMRRTAV
jgi:ABC-2 type transport system permease protein